MKTRELLEAKAASKTKIDCNVHMSTFKATGHGGRGDTLPHKEPLGYTGEFTFVYDYPLDKPAKFTHDLKATDTPLSILKMAATDYQTMYKEEQRTSKTDVDRAGSLLNRNKTDGRYGIWGHDMGDLYFETIKISPKTKKITFDIGS